MTTDFLSLTAPGVAGLHPYQPGKPLEELEREYAVTDAVKLASNENPLGAGKLAIKAMHSCEQDIARYPDGSGYKLKQLLAKQLEVKTENITLGNGSSEILELVARTFVTPEDEVIFSEHAFAVYPILSQAVGATAVVTPAKHWGHDLSAMRDAVTEKTRLIFVANPNNPTGTWLESKALLDFVSSIPSNVLVLIDEAYFEYVNEDDYPDTIKWLDQYQNLIITRTFSKIHGLAGLRIGYGITHSKVADLLNRVRQPFNSNSPALAAAEAALQDYSHINESLETNSSGMVQLITAFEKIGLNYIPSVGNFICVEFDQPGVEIYEALLHKGVIVRPIAVYGMPKFLRITIGSEKENSRFIQALNDVLE
ncbi:MAG: histidinol-phosphate transaminase [Gammaproteobacteria bacterium]